MIQSANPRPAQVWTFIGGERGPYHIQSHISNLYLDVYAAADYSGSPVCQAKYDEKQVWTVTPAPGACVFITSQISGRRLGATAAEAGARIIQKEPGSEVPWKLIEVPDPPTPPAPGHPPTVRKELEAFKQQLETQTQKPKQNPNPPLNFNDPKACISAWSEEKPKSGAINTDIYAITAKNYHPSRTIKFTVRFLFFSPGKTSANPQDIPGELAPGETKVISWGYVTTGSGQTFNGVTSASFK